MQDKIYWNALLDFYGVLLTDKQREICTYYYREDYSLEEISEIENISRSAVYDMINRVRKILADYENKLGLLSSYEKRRKLYEEMNEIGDETIKKLVSACMDTEI